MKTQYNNITIKAKFLGTKSQKDIWSCSPKWMVSNVFEVAITNTDTSEKGVFKFHGSHADWKDDKTELTEDDLLGAFYCFLTDALVGAEGEDEYYNQFGADASKKVFNGCVRGLNTFDRVIGGNIYEYIEEFQEAHEGVL